MDFDVKLDALVAFDPVRLHEVWDHVGPGCARVFERGAHRCRAEDVYAALRDPKSATGLYFFGEGGFLVAQRHVLHDGPRLFVWVLHGPNELKHRGALTETIERDLDAIARSIGARSIRFHSARQIGDISRAAWHRMGYEPVEIIYERKVL